MNHVSRFLGVFLFIAAISQFHLECYAEFAQDGDGTIARPRSLAGPAPEC